MQPTTFWLSRWTGCTATLHRAATLEKINFTSPRGNSLASLSITSLSLRDRFVKSVVSQQVTVLNCLKKILPFELRIDLYPAFIAPRFNYCSESWHHCGKRVSGKLEKINKQALRFVTRDKSTTYETLLKQLNLLSPFNQRIVKMATGVYKAIHGYKVPKGIRELLQERSTNYNLRGKHILELPKVNKSPMVLNHGVILQLRFGTLFRIIFAALIKSEHLRTWCLCCFSQILHFNRDLLLFDNFLIV